MFGKNPIRGLEPGDGSILQVQDIFYTIQGEGPYSGTPALFIRLGGCNLACSFCDTEFESFKPMAVYEIIARADELISVRPAGRASLEPRPMRESAGERGGIIKLAVITGGEPLRQNITQLCESLIENGFTVQIETNGTLFRPLPDEVKIICSPKNLKSLRSDLLARLDALKFVVSEHMPEYHDVPDMGQGEYNIPVYVQPMDEHDEVLNRRNMQYAAEMAKTHGYHLSLQLHKIVGMK